MFAVTSALAAPAEAKVAAPASKARLMVLFIMRIPIPRSFAVQRGPRLVNQGLSLQNPEKTHARPPRSCLRSQFAPVFWAGRARFAAGTRGRGASVARKTRSPDAAPHRPARFRR